MNDVQKIAEERASRPREKPIGAGMQTEHRIAKNAVVQQINALDGANIHKIAAKVLANRLKLILPLLISEEQSARLGKSTKGCQRIRQKKNSRNR